MTIKSDVCAYVEEYCNVDFEVRPQHLLSSDLLIHGTYGMYFICDFAEHFKIDFSEMAITRHFHCEHVFEEWSFFIGRVFGTSTDSKEELIELCVADLISSVELGKWSDIIYKERLKLE